MRGGKFAIWLVALYLALLALIAGVALVFASGLPEGERRTLEAIVEERGPLLAFLAMILFFACAGVIAWLFRRYVAAAGALAEQVRIAAGANPTLRVTTAGGPELAELADAVNRLSEARLEERDRADARAAEAATHVGEERNRLAALMSELSEGVVVCNAEGRILLFNGQARTHFGAAVGLGRSIFAIVDRDRVAHAVDGLRRDLERGQPPSPRTLAATLPGGGAVRARAAPFLAADGAIAGLVFTLDCIAPRDDGSRTALLEGIGELRRGAASIRAAAENLAAFPGMTNDERARFATIVSEESERLARAIENLERGHAEASPAHIGLEDVPLADFVGAVGERVSRTTGAGVTFTAPPDSPWIKVEGYAWAVAFAALAERLRKERGAHDFALRSAVQERFVAVDLSWRGSPVDAQTLATWEASPLATGPAGVSSSFREILDRHGATAWPLADAANPGVRFLVPRGEPLAPRRATDGKGRPEYYDFDLFRATPPEAGLGSSLAGLDFTVFDTETTGLEPAAGDKIISIGAVRIVNGRLLKGDVYEQLVDPGRPVPRESIRIHGIEESALAGQPAIAEVLPAFHRFSADTVLVAHNAAFDMRFLEMAQPAAGVRFEQPVLDTLLLSAFAHPNQADHRLEAIADRLGVAVIGRHTALGDALVTAEVFLKLLGPLAERGVRTLGEALAASRETYYARLRY